MELRVLGPVELVGADGPVPLGGEKQRRLLAAFAIRAGEALPAAVLVDAVWGPTPPPSAGKLLQVYVSQLRKLLEPPIAIRTRPGGYVLDIVDGALDLARFERLLQEGRAAAAEGNPDLAASLIGRALGLWRGPAFGELAYEDFAVGEAQRVEELRLIAREEQLEAELELGGHFELLPELRSRAGAEPLRERAQAQAMLALYRCGLHAESLEVYSATYARLRDELGLEPSADLQDLQRRILQQDATLACVKPLTAPAPSLPASPNPLVGRERELAELRDLLLRDEVRLVALTGAGGSGKTRLALEAARATLPHFANGAVFVALASLTDPMLVPEAIARACGVQQVHGGDALEGPLTALRSRELLLVLDNFEHLRSAAPGVVALLAGAPRLKALVTSRVVLHVSGEHVYPVQTLPIDDAVALFQTRAHELDPNFSPDPGTEEAIEQVCARLDGLPLAIELAAARTRVLTPSQLHARLDARLPLLTGGPHDLPARQRTLRATLQWSYDLLAAPEQRLLRVLSVFAGGFALRATEEICDARIDTLEALVDHSLVRRLPEGRFDMLETIREFALERFNQSGEARRIRERHAAHFCELALSANLREDADGEERHDLVITDRGNIRAALSWALETDRIELGLEIAVALESFWWTNAAQDGRRWFEAFLGRGRGITPRLRARGLRAYGTTTVFAVGDLEAADGLYEQSLAIYRELGDERGAAGALCCLAANAGDRGDVATGRRLIEQSLEIVRRGGSKREQAVALKILGKVECDDGNCDRGIELLQRAAALAGEAGAMFEQGYCLGELCERAFEAGRTAETAAWGRQCLEICHKVGDRQTQLFVLTLLARTALQSGRARQAGVLWGAVEVQQNRAPPGWWTLTPDSNRYARWRYIAPLLRERHPEFEQGREEGHRLSMDDTISRVVTWSAEPRRVRGQTLGPRNRLAQKHRRT